MNNLKKIIFFLAIILFASGCGHNTDKPENIALDLNQVRQNRILTAVTSYNSTDYFIYRGELLGFQYELLNLFAKHLGVKLRLIVTNNLETSFRSLTSFNSQIVAIGISPNKVNNEMLAMTEPYTETRQVLVQRKPDCWKNMRLQHIDSLLVRDKNQLAGKTIWIQKDRSYSDLLNNIKNEIRSDINVVEDDQNGVEELIKKVADGEIDFTVCDEHVALVNSTYYPNIDIQTALSQPVNLSWVVRKDSKELYNEINRWMKEFKKSTAYILLYNKYFRNPRLTNLIQKEILSVNKGIISPYDKEIRRYSKRLGWDWRLVASLIYQESQFDPGAMAWTGAYGLMQLMPYNLSKYGMINSLSTSGQIKAGVELLIDLNKLFAPFIWNNNERIKFVLAAYNAGIGQIADARMLAKKYGKNPYLWEHNVDTFILLKSNPKYYLDPVTQYGYCRGIETYLFVSQVLDRYYNYKNFIKK